MNNLETEITTLKELLAELASRKKTARATKDLINLLKAYAGASRSLAAIMLADIHMQADPTNTKDNDILLKVLTSLADRRTRLGIPLPGEDDLKL